MKSIPVSASESYKVLIGTSILLHSGEYVSAASSATKAAIISDSNVWPLYGEAVSNALRVAGIETVAFVFPAGEESKTATTYLQILNFLSEHRLTRSDILVALGGGVVGDITGFAAATYLRGVPYIQIPTTLLAMVDSSVGGKTAIDLPGGKNLVGAFYQPSLVICDTALLNTLPDQVFRDGCAEVIKYGVLYDPALFDHLSEYGLGFDREAVICRCIALKRDVVTKDEFDNGERQKLNLGHTFGHGIEACSNYEITHGQAVAAGMGIILRSAAAGGFCSTDVCNKVLSVLERFHLPVTTDYSSEALLNAALSDKKRSGSTVNLIIPTTIGNAVIHKTPISSLQSFIEAGL